MKLRQALEDKELDLRLIDRLVAEGKITTEAVDKHLAGLPDEEGNYIRLDSEARTETVTTTEE